MEDRLKTTIQSIYAANVRVYVVTTGGGGQALAWMLGVPGASKAVLEVLVPYSEKSFRWYAGYEPKQKTSVQTARVMARIAYHRGRELAEPGVPVVGIACTASIVSNRPKKSDHRCHVAAVTSGGGSTYSVKLIKGLRDRAGEEDIVSRLIIRVLADVVEASPEIHVPLVESECIEIQSDADPLTKLVRGEVDTVIFGLDGSMATDVPVEGGILSGSFNPVHEAHWRLAKVASNILRSPITFELSMENVDKPTLSEQVLLTQVEQFKDKSSVVITRAKHFYEKARLFPGCTFVIGFDTAARLISPEYYGEDSSKVDQALSEINSLGCRFLVAGRFQNDKFHTFDESVVAKKFQLMFRGLSEEEFRLDLSSTELRKQRPGDAA